MVRLEDVEKLTREARFTIVIIEIPLGVDSYAPTEVCTAFNADADPKYEVIPLLAKDYEQAEMIKYRLEKAEFSCWGEI